MTECTCGKPLAYGVCPDLRRELAKERENNERDRQHLLKRTAQLAEDLSAVIEEMQRREAVVVEALEFYAKGNHFQFHGSDEFEPEAPSGEPENWECGGAEGSDFTLENGGVARKALAELSKPCGG